MNALADQLSLAEAKRFALAAIEGLPAVPDELRAELLRRLPSYAVDVQNRLRPLVAPDAGGAMR